MKVKKIVRHSYVSVLFIVGLAISCFVLINVSDLVSNMLRDNQQLHGYTFEKYVWSLYQESISSESESTVTLEALSCAEEVTAGNVFALTLAELNKSLDQYQIHVLIKQNEETGLSYTPLDGTNKKNGAIMGESLKSHLLKRFRRLLCRVGRHTHSNYWHLRQQADGRGGYLVLFVLGKL